MPSPPPSQANTITPPPPPRPPFQHRFHRWFCSTLRIFLLLLHSSLLPQEMRRAAIVISDCDDDVEEQAPPKKLKKPSRKGGAKEAPDPFHCFPTVERGYCVAIALLVLFHGFSMIPRTPQVMPKTAPTKRGRRQSSDGYEEGAIGVGCGSASTLISITWYYYA